MARDEARRQALLALAAEIASARVRGAFDEDWTPFDLTGFDNRTAALLGIETPAEYAQRKAEEAGLAAAVGPVDGHSFARKLVALLGPDWTWSASDDGAFGTALVWLISKPDVRVSARGQNSEFALRQAALTALANAA